MTLPREKLPLRMGRAFLNAYDRVGLSLSRESRFLPEGADHSAVNERIVSANLWVMSICSFTGMMVMVGMPLLASFMNWPARVIFASFALGLIALVMMLLAIIPISRCIARTIVRQEIRRLGVRICTRCGYDCRGTETPVCSECGSAVESAGPV